MGMLDAACPGEVFTSPTPDQMHAATKAVDGGAGVLHIVKNYTGDVMNFEMAAELARAEGIEVDSVVIARRRRGARTRSTPRAAAASAATVLAEKIVGAAAEAGADLAEVADALPRGQRQRPLDGHGAHVVHRPGRRQADVRARRRRDGDRRRHPRRAGPQADEGRHGGRDRRRCWPTPILDDLPFQAGRQGAGLRERHGRHAADRALRGLQRAQASSSTVAGSRSRATWSARYITSLEMAGCSITLLRLDDELTKLWDAPVNTPGLRWGV